MTKTMSTGVFRSSLFCMLGIFLGATVLSRPVDAADRVWAFQGSVASYASGVGFVSLADLPVGSIVRGQVHFDDAELDGNPAVTTGEFSSQALLVILEGTANMYLGATPSGALITNNDLPVGGGLRDKIGVQNGGPIFFAGLNVEIVGFDLDLSEVGVAAPTALVSDALPSALPPLADFTTSRLLQMIGYATNSTAVQMDVSISAFGEPGTSELPLVPDEVTLNADGSVTWTFSTLGVTLCVSGCWVDPPTSSSFEYQMTNGALFTGIVDFPTGFSSNFEVSIGGVSQGTFGPGDSIDFTTEPAGGVASFTISGISPAVGLNAATAFPLQLSFDSTVAEFTMTSEVAPSVPALGWPGLGLVVALFGLANYTIHRGRRSGLAG